MSATVPTACLRRSTTPLPGRRVEILPEERRGELAVRLDAARAIRRMSADAGDYKALAARVRELHRPGTLTLVVANTVPAARDVYKELRGGPVDCTLLHSRFRGIERAGRMAEVVTRPEDRIVVSTQVVEAGIDLSAAVAGDGGGPVAVAGAAGRPVQPHRDDRRRRGLVAAAGAAAAL